MPRWDVSFDTRLGVDSPAGVTTVARAEALATVIRNVPIVPEVQHKLDRLNILRAVRGTTGIEGSDLTEEEVDRIMSAKPGERVLPPSREREELEARNAEEVMRFVADLVSRDSAAVLTEALIKEIHALTTRDIDYAGNRPGYYRSGPVQAGTYLAPPPDTVPNLMTDFIVWFNEGPARDWPAPVKAIIAHFYVISIHPFQDGNGRTSRAVESFLLYRGGINARGFYSLANFYYRYRHEYERMLDHVRFETDGNLTPFLQFALNGLVTELQEVHAEVLREVKLMAFRDYCRELIFAHSRSLAAVRQYNFLLALGRDSVELTQIRHGGHPIYQLYRGYSVKTLARDLDFLKKHELVTVEKDTVTNNLEVMDQFTASSNPFPL